jgi:esterase/lipase superfamily enzyme
MSGRFDLTIPIQDFRDLFDGYHNTDIYLNMPAQFTANIDDEVYLSALRQIEFIFAIGETDPFICNNHRMSQVLWHKEIPNQLHIWDGYAHRPRYWKQMVQLYL